MIIQISVFRSFASNLLLRFNILRELEPMFWHRNSDLIVFASNVRASTLVLKMMLGSCCSDAFARIDLLKTSAGLSDLWLGRPHFDIYVDQHLSLMQFCSEAQLEIRGLRYLVLNIWLLFVEDPLIETFRLHILKLVRDVLPDTGGNARVHGFAFQFLNQRILFRGSYALVVNKLD